MIQIPTEFSETTTEIMSEVDAFTLDEKSAVVQLVRIMALSSGTPEETLAKIANEARIIVSRFEGKGEELFNCISECLWALVLDTERSIDHGR